MNLLLNLPLGVGYQAAAPGGGGGEEGVLIARTMSPFNSSGFGNGRISFYLDYSELSTTGTHTWSVRRTHGTQGAVGCTYTIYDDDGTTVLDTGTLSWAAGNADILTISTTISSKSDGEHRTRVELTSATGGATLHQGTDTVAYGVIDDDTVSSDAVFFDAAAVTNGSGTSGSPYDNIYDAITYANSNGTRWIYGKGTVIPDGTNSDNPYGQSNYRTISVPADRSGEDTRVYISSWPGGGGGQLTIDGNGGTVIAGFFGDSDESFCTYRKVNFDDLDCTGIGGAPGFAIWNHYGTNGARRINVERCDFNDINGSENNGGVNYYGSRGGKTWRCTFANIAKDGDTGNGNTAGVFSYSGTGQSIQRCDFASTMSRGTYHKRSDTDSVTFACSFNIYRSCFCYYGQSGGGNPGHNGILVTNNLFTGQDAQFHHNAISTRRLTAENEVSNNYFYNVGVSVEGACSNRGAVDVRYHGNIYHDCHYIYTDESAFTDDLPLYFEYNIHYNTTNSFAAIDFTTYSETTFESTFSVTVDNFSTSDPDPDDVANDDINLGVSSSATDAGIDGNDCGVYLAGIEKIGPTGIVVYS